MKHKVLLGVTVVALIASASTLFSFLPKNDDMILLEDNLDALTNSESGVAVPCEKAVSVCSFDAVDADGTPIRISITGLKN